MKELFLLQKALRTSTKTPIIDNLAWEIAPFIREYFGNRYNGEQILTEYDEDIKIWVQLSDYIESNIFWQGVEEEDRGQVKLLKKMLCPDQVFFDVGANVGVITMLAAKRLTNGEVHAFEPSEYHLEKLHRNLRVNDFENVVVNGFGLSNREKTSDLYIPRDNGKDLHNTGMATIHKENGSTGDNGKYRTEKINTRKLDDYVEENDIQRLDVLKLDVEGGELNVLRGGLESLASFRPDVLMELNREHLSRAGETPGDVLSFWQEHNYDVYRIGYEGEIIEVTSTGEFDEHQNIYCCPKEYQS